MILTGLLILPSLAAAAGETANADVSINPRSATFYTNSFVSANWAVETTIIPAPAAPTVTPMKVASLGLPAANRMTFNPSASMPICADDQLGPPPTTNSIPVPQMLERCPNSLLGNGTAIFALGQSTNPLANLNGEILVFNGGLVAGKPQLKVYAYSYDTGVGIYTSAILEPDGQLRFDIPRLTADSSVRTMNLSIPGEEVIIEKPNQAITVILPAGQDPNYVQAKCSGGGFPWTADFTLGSRDVGGNPIGPPEFIVGDSGTDPCSGVLGQARISSVRVFGPARVKRNRLATYRVRVRNSGNMTAEGVRLIVAGRGLRFNARVGRINSGATRVVNVRIRPRSIGRIRASFRVVSSNAGSKTAIKMLTVVR